MLIITLLSHCVNEVLHLECVITFITWDPKWYLPEMEFQPSIINFACITFHCVWNEMKFCFGSGPRKTAHSVRANHSYFDEINACPDAYFRVILFQIVFTWHFITRNEILFLSKWPQCISFWVIFLLWFCKYKLWFFGIIILNLNTMENTAEWKTDPIN